jgi:hypothetical protein
MTLTRGPFGALILSNCEPSGFPSAERLRAEMGKTGTNGERMNAEGVDFEKLAELIATDQRPAGWEAPRILPPLWEETERGPDGGTVYECRTAKIRAILSCSTELDNRAWLHLSVSHKSRIPRWTELAEAKRVFLGDREAYQVLPPKERYVNINARVLHLFALLDGATALPDFTRGTGSL